MARNCLVRLLSSTVSRIVPLPIFPSRALKSRFSSGAMNPSFFRRSSLVCVAMLHHVSKRFWRQRKCRVARGSFLSLYTYIKGNTKKLYKLYTTPTFNPASCWFSVSCEMYSLRCKPYTNYTLNYTQQPNTKHRKEPAQNPAQRAFRTLHSERSRNYTRSGTQTYILFLNTNLANGTNEREWIVRNECNVRNERNERCSLFGRLLIKWTFFIQLFPHPTPFFGFNTSCFWRWKVLYLYRDMGGASAPPFFSSLPL